MDNSDKIKTFYEDYYTDYDTYMQRTGHYDAQIYIIDQLDDQISEPILDVACETGILIKELLKKYSKISGNDFSSTMSETAKDKTSLLITNENAEILNSYNQKFKTIICCNCLYYLQDRDKAICRWTELLEKDGKIIFLEEYPFMKPARLEMKEHADELMSLISPMAPVDIEELMNQNNLNLEKKVKTKIDENHDLFGLVFSLES